MSMTDNANHGAHTMQTPARDAFTFIMEAMESSATDYGDAGTVADEDMPDGSVRAHFTDARHDCMWDLYNGSHIDNVDYDVTDNGRGFSTFTVYGFLPGYGDSARRSL